MSRANPPEPTRATMRQVAEDSEPPAEMEVVTSSEPEPEPKSIDYTCKKCGAKFAGEGAQKAYRTHLADFHPSDG